jgi:hypothetical protein
VPSLCACVVLLTLLLPARPRSGRSGQAGDVWGRHPRGFQLHRRWVLMPGTPGVLEHSDAVGKQQTARKACGSFLLVVAVQFIRWHSPQYGMHEHAVHETVVSCCCSRCVICGVSG